MKFVKDLYDHEKRKWNLLKTYDSFSLDDVIDGKVVKNEFGCFYLMEKTVDIPRKEEKKEDDLYSELRLIKGIGEKRKKALEARGIKNISDLLQKEIYAEDAQNFLDEIHDKRYLDIYRRIGRNLPRSHPIHISFLDQIGLENILFFDIECSGFKKGSIFLIGTASFIDDKLKIDQFFARSEDEEKSILKEFESEMRKKLVLVSFNGKRFDENVIKNRRDHHDMEMRFSIPHVDLLPLAKKRWRNICGSHGLSNLESQVLNIQRQNDIPSVLIPHFYRLFLEKDNPGPLIPIIEHNRIDLISIAKLLLQM